jgi:hypothetical protein
MKLYDQLFGRVNMGVESESLPPGLAVQGFIFLFGLLDDAVLIGLSRLGMHIPGLRWVSPILLGGTVIYMSMQLFRKFFVPRKVS